MHEVIKQMMAPYNCQTPGDYKNAFKEIIQEITLLGLSRQGFFDVAAFYGGTALRIVHKLGRFSEDLDFSLLKLNKKFDLSVYLKGIEDELIMYNLKMKAEIRKKTIETTIESAFLKGNTLDILLSIEEIEQKKIPLNKNDIVFIKLEIDTEPPTPSGTVETVFSTFPIPFSFKIYSLPSLFAGKLHAILCRKFKSGRVKGRDFYDFIWYMNKGIIPDLKYLKAKMIQTGHWNKIETLDLDILKKLLAKRFSEVDWKKASKDVAPYIKDPFELEVWSKDFFTSLIMKWK
jgi:predicted nucleotidyltransferase component of viral defense system